MHLNGLEPGDVTVEVVYGKSLGNDELSDVSTLALSAATDPDQESTGSPAPGNATLFTGTVQLDRGGAFGYTVRVVPRNDLLISPAEMGLIAVAG